MTFVVTRILSAGLALTAVPALAQVSGTALPGVTVVVTRKPPYAGPAIATTTVSDAKGGFTLTVKDPGRYSVSTACTTRPCLPRRLSVNIAGAPARAAPGGDYDLFVMPGRPVTITGFILQGEAPGTVSQAGSRSAPAGNTPVDFVNTTSRRDEAADLPRARAGAHGFVNTTSFRNEAADLPRAPAGAQGFVNTTSRRDDMKGLPSAPGSSGQPVPAKPGAAPPHTP